MLCVAYNKRMKFLPKAAISWWRLALWLTSLLTLLLSFFLFIPVFTALRAGIAGVGLVLFTPLMLSAGLLTYVFWRKKEVRSTALAGATAFIALVAIIGSNLGYVSIAQREGVQLGFNPITYTRFTGDSIQPIPIDFAYKEVEGKVLRFALYHDDLTTPKPTVILVHGGGWQYGNYLRTNNWPKLLRDAGYQVISVEYRLATADVPTWDKAPSDIHDAITFIKTYALKLGVDASKIALFGQSAGGHLALLEAHSSSSVEAVVGLYAPTDLTEDFKLSIDKDAELAFLGGTPSDYPQRYRAVSVAPYVKDTSPTTLLIQGTSDDLVDRSSGQTLGETLEKNRVKHRLVFLPFTGHSFDNQVGGFATQITEQVVLDFLAESL